MSWSEGRKPVLNSNEKKAISEDHKEKLENIRQINGVLEMFSKDEDLQDDLKLSNVRMALDHWSGIKRMPPEIYSKRLETDRRVNAVYPKLKLLQSVCMQANMKVPLDHMLDGRAELDSYALTTCFGADFCILHNLTRPLTPKNTPRLSEVRPVTLVTAASKKLANEFDQAEKVDDDSHQNPSDTFSFWKSIVESCESADWIGIFFRTFRQQFYVLIITVVIAYIFGFVSLESLRIL